jgi:hypothetical protein
MRMNLHGPRRAKQDQYSPAQNQVRNCAQARNQVRIFTHGEAQALHPPPRTYTGTRTSSQVRLGH